MPSTNSQYLRWTVPEYHKPERSQAWYISASIIIILLLGYSFFDISGWRLVWLGTNSNFLFALIIVVSAIILTINDIRTPVQIKVELGPEGVKVGRTFYDYDRLKNFSVLYKPKQSIKNLYFEFKNSIHPRISLPLRRLDALETRNFLIRYLDEDLERTQMPLSEQLTKLLKL